MAVFLAQLNHSAKLSSTRRYIPRGEEEDTCLGDPGRWGAASSEVLKLDRRHMGLFYYLLNGVCCAYFIVL